MPVTITKNCLWCGSKMETERCNKFICSTKCANRFSYLHRSKYSHLTKDQFKALLKEQVKNGVFEINPDYVLEV